MKQIAQEMKEYIENRLVVESPSNTNMDSFDYSPMLSEKYVKQDQTA